MTDCTTTLPALATTDPVPTDRNPAAVYLASLSTTSGRASMVSTLRKVAEMVGYALETCPWHEMRYSHVTALRAALSERHAPATANKYLSAIRSTAKHAWLLGMMEGDDYHRIAAVPNVKGSRLPAGRALDGGEIAALSRACADGSPAGARDAAAFALMFGCGLRRAETIALDLADYDATTGAIRVMGKGNKERLVYAVNGAGMAIDGWIAIRGDAPGPLLSPVGKSGKVATGRRMTAPALVQRLAKRTKQAGVADCSPHDLRRSFVSSALESGADLAMVQALAGHASPTTTARYDRRPENAKRAAAKLVHFPYFATDPTKR